ncbi:MAG: DoxX family protein [Rubricoccaceae bacterium]|nr:DoxX family protein [Rubricoccaceae bacterium]
MKGYAALPLRVVIGGSFMAHGITKFTGGIENTAGFFESLGIPAAGLMAPVVATVETLGGLAILTGAFVPIASILLTVVMLVAMFTFHISNGFFFMNQPPGIEVNLLFIAGLLSLMFMGAGPMSLDESRSKQPAEV